MAAPEKEPSSTLNNLVGSLLEELADEIPDDLKLDAVKTDLVAASHSYENSKKKDLALRFYLATRALLREYEVLHERLRHMEKKNQALEAEKLGTYADVGQDAKPEVHTDAATGAGA